MKHLLIAHFLIAALILPAQEPLIYFDKTRCQKQTEIHLEHDGKFPHSLDVSKLVPTNLPVSAMTLWEKTDAHFEKKKLVFGNEKRILFAKTGFYILVVFDPINAQLIEISIGEKEVNIIHYINCVLHY